jgi:hypothetical protein
MRTTTSSTAASGPTADGWRAVAELLEQWDEGVATSGDATAIARRVDGVLVIDTLTTETGERERTGGKSRR